jgi:hypothetical protein
MPHRGISAAQSPEAFASMHFGGLDLGDRRLTRRAERVAAAIASCPHASLPRQCGDPHQAKGAYRLFDHDAVTSHSISRRHRDRTLDAARERDVVLFIQDTTELSFAESRAGVGPIGYGESAHGLLMHSTLAITPGGVVLGLADLKIWARGPARRGESQAKRRVREGRESLRWKEAIEAVGAPPANTRWIHVGDREADVWETFVATLEVGSDCVIRACGAAAKRKASIGHGEPKRADATSLDTLARTLPQAGACEVERHARPGVPRRTMRLRVSFAPVTLLPPRLTSGERPLHLWVVRAWEDESEWVIVTTLPVLDVIDALKVVDHYRRRWTIEEYHKCLKTGCRLEARQLQDRTRLEPLAAMLAIVALRLLNLKHVAKLTPEAPATDAVPEAYVRVLSKLRGIPESELTCRRFWRETARLGGFLARNSDGDPGWQTLWLGWHDLELIVQGARVAQPSRYG